MYPERGARCLILDQNGGINIILRRGDGEPFPGHPNWQCTNWECPLKMPPETYKDSPVKLGYSRKNKHGVVYCGAVGRAVSCKATKSMKKVAPLVGIEFKVTIRPDVKLRLRNWMAGINKVVKGQDKPLQ